MTTFTSAQELVVNELKTRFPDAVEYRRADIIAVAESIGSTKAIAKGVIRKMNIGTGRGMYTLSNTVVPFAKEEVAASVTVQSKPVPPKKVTSIVSEGAYVPAKVAEFVKWGHFSDVLKIIKSNLFYPVYITGLSGNGKTMMVEQACAEAKREYIRVQITPETDEDDLIGGFRLLNGETIFAKGPVIKAMEAGAILLIDEIDRGSNKLMALQGVLEGKPVLIKKTGELVSPAPGFNIIATSNTKGKGSEDGRFISATIIDEAFLERFTITIEQPYPSEAFERRIVLNHMKMFNVVDEEFASALTKWGSAIRATFEDGGVDEIISTRRLCHIVQTYSIFGDKVKSVNLCLARFDADTKEAFMSLYTKIDSQDVASAEAFDGVATDQEAPF